MVKTRHRRLYATIEPDQSRLRTKYSTRTKVFCYKCLKSSFSTPKYESRAREILLRDKEAKIEKRASLRRFVMPKSKRSTFSQRDIFWTISLSMDMRQTQTAGSGVVEGLLGKVHQGRRGYQSRSLAEQVSWNYVEEAPIGTKQMA